MNSSTFQSDAISYQLNLLGWDTKLLKNCAVQLDNLEIRDEKKALSQLKELITKFSKNKVILASCRLPHNSIKESMILEDLGFKFVEMVLHPFADLLSFKTLSCKNKIEINEAKPSELEELSVIAEIAFKDDRFSVDERIPDGYAGKRYKNWVLSCVDHPSQKVLKFSLQKKTIGFFIIEEDKITRKAYWHLTAISPKFQGQGLGTECWKAMISDHKSRDIKEVSTTISARNSIVLNLYTKLDFRFRNPEITLHWINEGLKL